MNMKRSLFEDVLGYENENENENEDKFDIKGLSGTVKADMAHVDALWIANSTPEWGYLSTDWLVDNKIPVQSPSIKYVFDEDKYIKEAMAHIDSTYTAHYAGEFQATQVIIDAGHGTGFNVGNIIKYGKRYGKKGGYNRADLLKIIHYAVMQLYVQDKGKV